MESLFLKLLNMSIAATWLVIAVLLMRLIFRKAPKWTFCLLWGLVALRLVMPFSIESVLSLVPSRDTVPVEILTSEEVQIQSGFTFVDNIVNPVISDSLKPEIGASTNPAQVVTFAAAIVWIMGMAAMLLYFVGSYLLLRLRLRTSVPYEKNIRQSERVQSPFVLGVFRPVIYLPFGMDGDTLKIVLAHEKAHIARRDHWWKPLGFILLSFYWFNPILWVAYVLLCRDIEAACDEKVIREMGMDYRKDYSAALLNCSVRRSSIMACPVAFGETNVKRRITDVMNYKKPAFWLIMVSIIACIVVAVCFLTNPIGKKDPEDINNDDTTPTPSVTVNANEIEYTYTKSDNTVIILALNPEEQTYRLYEKDAAYGGFGIYAFLFKNSNELLQLIDGSGRGQGDDIYVFNVSGDQLIFDKSQSSSNLQIRLEDSATFVKKSQELPQDKGEPYSITNSTTIRIAGTDYDLRERYQEINAITKVTTAGFDLVIESHVSPSVSVYSIFNMQENSFKKDIISNTMLLWRGNDITSAVYMYGNEVRSYNGAIIKQLHLGKDERCTELKYDEDGNKVTITIRDDEKEIIREETLDWLDLSTFSSAMFDIDGDGVVEACTIKFGPTSGIKTVIFTAYAYGVVKYMNTYVITGDIAFAEVDGTIRVANNGKMHNIHVENGDIVIDDLDGHVMANFDMNY